jgi:hypothetical protein
MQPSALKLDRATLAMQPPALRMIPEAIASVT